MSDIAIDKSVSILIVDDSEGSRLANQLVVQKLVKQVSSDQVNIQSVGTPEEMYLVLKDQRFHLVLLDYDLGTDGKGQQIDGVDHIPNILAHQPTCRILMLTSANSIPLAVRALKQGAKGFIKKPESEDERTYQEMQILNALKESQAEIEFIRSKYLLTEEGEQLKYRSRAMQDFEHQLKIHAQYSTPILFLGASGLGKTHAAKRLNRLAQDHQKQKSRPLVNLNVTAISPGLVDAELFGSEKGSFTGSVERKIGLFEMANGGDIFLDEIGELPFDQQAKLLKVLEEKEFRRVGGNVTLTTDARIILATNRNLDEMVKNGTFREDLYARISAFTLTLPPLEDRKDDIPLICQEIIDQISKAFNKQFSFADFPPALQKWFQRDNIPFNIRGIRSDIERLALYCPTNRQGRIDFSSWKAWVNSAYTEPARKVQPKVLDLDSLLKSETNFIGSNFPGIAEAVKIFEAAIYKEAGRRFENQVEAAKALQVSKSNYYYRARKLNPILESK